MEVWWPPIKVYFTPFTNMTLRVFESFAGVGSQRMALRNLDIDHEVVAIAEIDKSAIKSYEAIHGETFNLGDISEVKVEDVPDCDLFTYSYPCTDLSLAGLQGGMVRGETRSGLLYECERIVESKKPKYLLMENVKNLVSKKFKPDFDKWLEYLESLGYTSYWQVLNAKDYGIPQNRERVFVVSILGEHEPYKFPEPTELKLGLKDVLEDNVDDRYTITQPSMISKLPGKEVPGTFGGRMLTEITDYAWTITTKQMRAPNSGVIRLNDDQFRYLTEKECWRLMGFDDEDFYSAEKEHPRRGNFLNGTLYRQAGNSIVVPVLEAIFKQLLKEESLCEHHKHQNNGN